MYLCAWACRHSPKLKEVKKGLLLSYQLSRLQTYHHHTSDAHKMANSIIMQSSLLTIISHKQIHKKLHVVPILTSLFRDFKKLYFEKQMIFFMLPPECGFCLFSLHINLHVHSHVHTISMYTRLTAGLLIVLPFLLLLSSFVCAAGPSISQQLDNPAIKVDLEQEEQPLRNIFLLGDASFLHPN